MHLVEILFPATKTDGLQREFQALSAELVERFGGLTTFVRSPGDGAWVDDGDTERDTVVVLEVMTMKLDREWWGQLRNKLERQLNQKEIVVRAYAIEKL